MEDAAPEVEDDADAWKLMSKDENEEEDVDFDEIMKQTNIGSEGDVLGMVDTVVAFADSARTTNLARELEERNMVKSNHMITLEIVLHEGETLEHHFRLNMVASAQFPNVQKAAVERMGSKWNASAKLRLSWLKEDGSLVELSQATWREYIFTNWCCHPWVVHAHDEASRGGSGAGGGGSSASGSGVGGGDDAAVDLPLTRTARLLFERYDINRNGVIELPELARLVGDQGSSPVHGV